MEGFTDEFNNKMKSLKQGYKDISGKAIEKSKYLSSKLVEKVEDMQFHSQKIKALEQLGEIVYRKLEQDKRESIEKEDLEIKNCLALIKELNKKILEKE